MGHTKDYRVNYSFAHVVGDPGGKRVTGVHVAPYKEAAFAKAEEIMRNGERNNIPTGVEIIHVNPDNGGKRSVIHFNGERVTPAIRWEVALYPDSKGPDIVREDDEIAAREIASNFTRTDQGVATIYRIVKVNGKNQREQVAILIPPRVEEIAEAHRINNAEDATAAPALTPFPNADHLIGQQVTLPSADPRQRTGTITGTVARVRPAPLGSAHAVAELASGYLVDLPASLVEATAPRGDATAETAPAPASAEDWATDVQAAAKLAETLGGELGTSLARMLDQIAFNFRKGQTPTVTGALAVSVRRVADAVTELAARRRGTPRVVLSPDRTLAAIEREPEHRGNGRFRVTNGGRYQPVHVADWDELGVI